MLATQLCMLLTRLYKLRLDVLASFHFRLHGILLRRYLVLECFLMLIVLPPLSRKLLIKLLKLEFVLIFEIFRFLFKITDGSAQ